MNSIKSLLALAITSALFVSCKQTASEPTKEDSAETKKEIVTVAKPETASFNIEGMTCAMGCAKTIEKKLAGMDGVQKATVDFDKKTATVEFDANKQTPEKLVEAVEATADGKTYKVSNVKSSGNKAMFFIQDQEIDKKQTKKKSKKAAGCCAGKKQCDKSEKKA